MATADELTARMIVERYRRTPGGKEDGIGLDLHLRECPDVTVAHPEAYDSVYGCDTGCEYVRMEADLSCPHGHSVRFEYGEFGDLDNLLREIEGQR